MLTTSANDTVSMISLSYTCFNMLGEGCVRVTTAKDFIARLAGIMLVSANIGNIRGDRPLPAGL